MSYLNQRKKIDQFQQQINSAGKLPLAVKHKIVEKFRLDWNYYSNKMEGNTLTRDETREVMAENVTVEGRPIKDIREMVGHDKVIAEILALGKGEKRLAEARIKTIHKGIMYEETEKQREKIGVWKTRPNEVINYKNERFPFVPPREVPERIHNLLDKTNAAIDAIRLKKKNAPHPVDVALRFHVEYLTIHPFYDGNGRTARIITNLLLISFGYPPFWIKTDEKSMYYQYLADVQAYGANPDVFMEFVADLIIRSQKLVLDAIEGKDIEEVEDMDKRVALLTKNMDGIEEPIKEAKSKKVMNVVLKKVVEPLFRKVFEKTLKITPMFVSARFSYYIDGRGGTHHNINDLMDDIDIGWNEDKREIQHIQFEIYLEGLKALGKKDVNMGGNLKISFDKHKYRININYAPVENDIIYLYHQIPTVQEINKIAGDLVNDIISRMEQLAERYKKK